MSRDYRHGHNTNNKGFQRRSQQQPKQDSGRGMGKVWLIGALVSVNFLGGFLVAKHFMGSSDSKEAVAPSEIYAEVTQPLEKPETKSNVITVEALPVESNLINDDTADDSSLSNATKYSFYQGLKATEVVVDAVPISVALDSAYYILAGTFGSEKVAMREQARLAGLGQVVKVSPIAHKNRTLYRLSVGPFNDRLVMNAKRNELRRLGVDTLLVKAK
ncbi:MAG: SPOR domain-containing protein [Thiotrichales bacterium]|nr:SPOR domain-containing protein [Thiotrichales bacterium]